MSPAPVCLVLRHSSPGMFLGRTSFFYLSYNRWSGICSLSSFLEKLAFYFFLWQPVFCQLCTACRGGDPSFYLADVTMASIWSCSLYSVCRGFLLPVTVMTLHLVAWNFIFHSTFQNPMVVRLSFSASCIF